MTVFFGSELSIDEYEYILLKNWNSKQRRLEPELLSAKWFDYRADHPVRSTYLFAHLYTEGVRKIIRQHINPAPPGFHKDGSVKDWEPIKAGDMFVHSGSKSYKTKVTSIINARQQADEWCMPYDKYITYGLKRIYFGRYDVIQPAWAKGEKMSGMAMPNFINAYDIKEHILSCWKAELESAAQIATHPRYLAQNDDGHPDTQAYRDWLFAQVRRKGDPKFLMRKLIALGHLTREQLAARFGDDLVARVLA